jgi:hypothetical protein
MYYSREKVLENFYEDLLNEKDPSRIHIPRSDVFYVRKAIEERTGVRYSLDHVERAMYLEGFLDKSDVFKPRMKREGIG